MAVKHFDPKVTQKQKAKQMKNSGCTIGRCENDINTQYKEKNQK